MENLKGEKEVKESKKHILLMISRMFDYEKKIVYELEQRGYDVTFIDLELQKYSEARKIKNPFIRLYNNKYLKKFKKIDLKDKLQGEKVVEDLKKMGKNYDAFLKIGCIYLGENLLKYLRKEIPVCISYHWDSSKKADKCNFELEKKYFDQVFSFDKKDVESYNLKYLTNFFFEKNLLNSEIEYDIYALMNRVEEKREILLKEIAMQCLKKGINIEFKLTDIKREKDELGIIKILKEYVSIDQMLEEMSKSKVILEINHSLNTGYTFRTFDCIGMKKKLITNNKNIIKEDFYNPNNILVIDEKNIEIPKEFVDSPYEELPKIIYEKYSFDGWLNQLLNVGEKK